MNSKLNRYLGLIITFSLILFTGCSNKDNQQNQGWKDNPDQQIKGKIKLWMDSDLIEAYSQVINDYQKLYPHVKVIIEAKNSNQIKREVAKDPSQAADVFLMNNTQVGSMADNGLLYPLRDQREQKIKVEQTDYASKAVTFKKNIYGYPMAMETSLLYYDRSKLKKQDVKNWDNLTKQHNVIVNFDKLGTGLTFAPLFFKESSYLEVNEFSKLNNGAEILNWISSQKNNPHIISLDNSIESEFRLKQAAAVIASSKQYSSIKKILQNNLAVSFLPQLNIDNKTKLWKPFLIVKLWGVNQQTKYPKAAMSLANYLGNKDTQLKLFKLKGLIPTNQSAQNDEKVMNSPLVQQIFKCIKTSRIVIAPNYLNDNSFWLKMDQLIKDTYQGNIKSIDYSDNLKEIDKKLNR